MNNIKVRKSEQKLLDDVKAGVLAAKVMKIPVTSDKMLQESDDEGDGSKRNSLAEQSKSNERGKKKDKKDSKADSVFERKEKVVYKDLDKLVEELKPRLLRKLIMAYMDVLSKLPEDAAVRRVNVAKLVEGLNSEKDVQFFEEFFVSLGQNCKKAEKGIKAGPMFINQNQVS